MVQHQELGMFRKWQKRKETKNNQFVKGIFDKKDENVFYKENLSQEYILKKAKDIKELRLLLSVFDVVI